MKKTPFAESHEEAGARMVEFAGWMMPVQYESIIEEARTVRTGAGMFDLSHMGRLRFTGRDAAAFLEARLEE